MGGHRDPRAPKANPPGFGPYETGLHPLANNVALELGHGPNDGEHGLADGRGGVELLLEGDESDIEGAERLQGRDQVLDRPREAIEAPDEDDLELAGPGRLHQPVECPPALLGARDAAVDELLDHLPVPLGRVRAEGDELDLGVLALGGHTGVEGDLHGRRLPLVLSASTRSDRRTTKPARGFWTTVAIVVAADIARPGSGPSPPPPPRPRSRQDSRVPTGPCRCRTLRML